MGGTMGSTKSRAGHRRSCTPWADAALALALALVPTAAVAQLDETCYVSALNRTVRVDADGTWVLPNVPTNSGPVRARATCVDNGTVRSGQSELVLIPPGNVVAVPEMEFEDAVPIPERLELFAPVAELTTVVETVQLQAIATYPGGATADLTAAATGTDYRTSNPAVASVDGDGLVTAHTSGLVLISALNEGALAMVRLAVVLSGDSDGDGIPDDLELAGGLDPNNPFDADADPDGDGLTSREELLDHGTDPQDPDTDDDGLEDGFEIGEAGTQPLLFDTDGDRISDGLEVQAGSDPLDAASANLAAILAGLSVAPESFTLVFNTLYGEASRLLTVTATLIDGTVLDATAARYGTSYSSSDLSVASFGAEPGRVFAGQDGTATITIVNGAFSVESFVAVETFSPRAVSFVSLPGSPNAVAVSDGHAYVACGSAGLHVVDVTSPQAPQRIGSLPIPGAAFEVTVAGTVAYVAAGAGGLQVVDATTPSAPVLIGAAPTTGAALDLAVVDDKAFVVDGLGLRVFDVSDPSAPFEVGALPLPGRPRGVDANGGLAVVAAEAAGVHVVDVSDPADPVLVGTTATRANGTSEASAVVLRESTVYVTDGARTLGGLKVIDVSVPSTPVVVGASDNAFGLNEVAADGRFVFGADYFFSNAVPIFNVEPRQPVFAAVVDFSGLPLRRADNGHGLAVGEGLVYLAGDLRRTLRFGLTGSGGLHIGRYLRPEEEPPAPQPPSVTILTPEAGAEIRERSFLKLRAIAEDDLRIDRVEFTVEGEVVATDFGSPYSATILVPGRPGSLSVGATAYDSAGNSAVAEPVVVTVIRDTRPTVRLLTPAEGAHAREGRTIVVAAEPTDDVGIDRVEFTVDGAVIGTRSVSPYKVFVAVPEGVASFSVGAVAYDTVEQAEVSDPVVVAVDPDAPPEVAILAPSDGGEVIEGGIVRVTVGAADDYGLDAVRLRVDGEDSGLLRVPPYEFAVRVALGPTTLSLQAEASDDRGQSTLSSPVVVAVIPDPATTVEGRVVDGVGVGVADADVTCGGIEDLSVGDGSFSLAGVATLAGAVSCRAEVTVGGETLVGATAPVAPVAGGITDVGSVVVLPQLLYLGAGDAAGFFPPGRLLVRDDPNDRLLAWSEPFSPSGISGLAFDALGGLYATTIEPGAQAVRTGPVPATGRARSPSLRPRADPAPLGGGFGETSLLRLDPDSGQVLAELGRVVDAEGSGVVIEDLAFDPASGKLFGVDAERFGGSVVYAIDLATAVATPVLTGMSLDSAALAIGGDGLVYVVGLEDRGLFEFGPLRLWAIEPADGTVVVSDVIDGTPGLGVGGLATEAGSRLLLASGKAVYALDLASRTLGAPSAPGGSYSGWLQALAVRPLVAPPAITTVVGRVMVEGGGPLAGVPVFTVGGSTATDAAGEFALPGVVARSGRVRAVAEHLGEVALSAAVQPVHEGVTDVGTLEVGETVCVTGALSYAGDCTSGPVTGVLSLEVLEGDEWLPAGTVTPEVDGSFCADVRRGVTFRLNQEDVFCDCGFSARCEAFLEVVDPGAEGRCEDPAPGCDDLGAVGMSCDSSCSAD